MTKTEDELDLSLLPKEKEGLASELFNSSSAEPGAQYHNGGETSELQHHFGRASMPLSAHRALLRSPRALEPFVRDEHAGERIVRRQHHSRGSSSSNSSSSISSSSSSNSSRSSVRGNDGGELCTHRHPSHVSRSSSSSISSSGGIPWTSTEDTYLRQRYAAVGSRWTLITADGLRLGILQDGRTANSLKSHWHFLVHKPKRHRSPQPAPPTKKYRGVKEEEGKALATITFIKNEEPDQSLSPLVLVHSGSPSSPICLD
jgi:hypothetical protein